MSKYLAVLMHGARGGEGRYEFTAEDDLIHKTPARIMRTFMDSVEAKNGIGDIDYEINAAMKNEQHKIATVIGKIIFEKDEDQPFMCMISPTEIA